MRPSLAGSGDGNTNLVSFVHFAHVPMRRCEMKTHVKMYLFQVESGES